MPHQALDLLKIIYKSELENNEISENDLAFYLLNPHTNNSENGKGGGRADLEAKLGAETNPIKSLLGIDPKTLSPEERDWLLSMHVVLKGDNGVYSYSHSRKNRRKPYVSLTLMQLWLLLEHQVFFHQFSVPFRAGVSQNLDRAHCGTWINTASLLSELNNIDTSHIEIVPPIKEFPSQHYWRLVNNFRLSFSTYKSYGRFSTALNTAWKEAQEKNSRIPHQCFSQVPFNDDDDQDLKKVTEIFKELGFVFTKTQSECRLNVVKNSDYKADLTHIAKALAFYQELNVIFEKSDFVSTKSKLPDQDKNANAGDIYTSNHQEVAFYKMCSAANVMLKDEDEQLDALKSYLSIMPNNTIFPFYSTKALLKAAQEIRTWFDDDQKHEFLEVIDGERIQVAIRSLVVINPVIPTPVVSESTSKNPILISIDDATTQNMMNVGNTNTLTVAPNNTGTNIQSTVANNNGTKANTNNTPPKQNSIKVDAKKLLTKADMENLLAQLPTTQHSYFYRLVFKQTQSEKVVQQLNVVLRRLKNSDDNQIIPVASEETVFLKLMLQEILTQRFKGDRISTPVAKVFNDLLATENFKDFKEEYFNDFAQMPEQDLTTKMNGWIGEAHLYHTMMGKQGFAGPTEILDFITARHQNKILTREVIKAHLEKNHDIADSKCSFFRKFKSH